MRFRGIVYRAHDPRWSWPPVSGEGARRYGGRFNRIGVEAFYTLVLWSWGDRRPLRVTLIDDERRLTTPRRAEP